MDPFAIDLPDLPTVIFRHLDRRAKIFVNITIQIIRTHITIDHESEKFFFNHLLPNP
jgi:hypothetical protein